MDYEYHEDILAFLEENISKLVKLKVASRINYKAYDDNYLNYLTAEAVDDNWRGEFYAEQVEIYRKKLWLKLSDAIGANQELLSNQIVAEYLKLMKK